MHIYVRMYTNIKLKHMICSIFDLLLLFSYVSYSYSHISDLMLFFADICPEEISKIRKLKQTIEIQYENKKVQTNLDSVLKKIVIFPFSFFLTNLTFIKFKIEKI